MKLEIYQNTVKLLDKTATELHCLYTCDTTEIPFSIHKDTIREGDILAKVTGEHTGILFSVQLDSDIFYAVIIDGYILLQNEDTVGYKIKIYEYMHYFESSAIDLNTLSFTWQLADGTSLQFQHHGFIAKTGYRKTLSWEEIAGEDSDAAQKHFYQQTQIKPVILAEDEENTEPLIPLVEFVEIEKCAIAVMLYYDTVAEAFIIKKRVVSIVKPIANWGYQLQRFDTLIISNEKEQFTLHIDTLIEDKKITFHTATTSTENIAAIIGLNTNRIYLTILDGTLAVYYKHPQKIIKVRQFLKMFTTRKAIYIFGFFVCHGKFADQKYDFLYNALNTEKPLAEFQRFLPKIKFLKNFGYYRIPIEMALFNEIHNALYIGDAQQAYKRLNFSNNIHRKIKVHGVQKTADGQNIFILRSNLRKNITLTILRYQPEYYLLNRIKQKVARIWAKLSFSRQKVNLYFEKKSLKADESVQYVFTEVMQRDIKSSKNYLILDSGAKSFKEWKGKYPKYVIAKHSFKHYVLIYQATCFISTELANHIINDRFFINGINQKVQETKLIFLQHGIMFAKPVENPMARGFYKAYNNSDLYKSVISSELEAKEFYKMGYDVDDLLLTGLATFDYAKLAADADKIVVMLTYRFWEEYLVYKGEIAQTSYFKTILRMIDAFKEAGLLSRLLIVPHSKFGEYMYENLPEYRENIMTDVTEALKEGVIFITDYSSGIYDAIYRGSFPIFYWEEQEMLIEQYKAAPPVHAQNAPGVIAYSIDAMMQEVQNAIANNYEVSAEHTQKYLAINKFTDNNNTKRIVDFLIEDAIL